LSAAPTRYGDPRAHELRAQYLATYPVPEIPVPVESIAEDLLGLRIEERDLGECSGMLIPSERLILVNAAEATNGDVWACGLVRTGGRANPSTAPKPLRAASGGVAMCTNCGRARH
jgi:hypothetical protein